LTAVQSNGNVLECVPEKLKTFEVCLAAVCNDINALEFVPKKYISKLPESFKCMAKK